MTFAIMREDLTIFGPYAKCEHCHELLDLSSPDIIQLAGHWYHYVCAVAARI